MNNRMVIGAFRYGRLEEQQGIDRVRYIHAKLADYEDTGNLENLIDLANAAMIEYRKSDHPEKHFKSLDDQQHGERRGA